MVRRAHEGMGGAAVELPRETTSHCSHAPPLVHTVPLHDHHRLSVIALGRSYDLPLAFFELLLSRSSVSRLPPLHV